MDVLCCDSLNSYDFFKGLIVAILAILWADLCLICAWPHAMNRPRSLLLERWAE